MMRDSIYIGSTPPEEDSAQVGSRDYDYRLLAKAECNLYIEVLREALGDEPTGARLTVKPNPHDFGTYYAVECIFDSDNEAATEYAFKCEGEGPLEWPDWAYRMISRFKRLCIHNHKKAVELFPRVKKEYATIRESGYGTLHPILAWSPSVTENEFNSVYNIPS